MAIKQGYVRWSDDAIGAILWDTEEKGGIAAVIDEVNGEVYDIGGGGGDNDFSTAKVTIDVNSLQGITINVPTIYDDGEHFALLPFANVYQSSDPWNVALYKGMALAIVSGEYTDIAATGDATVSNEGIYITGDCTINIS